MTLFITKNAIWVMSPLLLLLPYRQTSEEEEELEEEDDADDWEDDDDEEMADNGSEGENGWGHCPGELCPRRSKGHCQQDSHTACTGPMTL